jgi:CubicO group peptidase (beta-lactamase class C family)
MSVRFNFDRAKLDALLEPFNRSDKPGLVVGVAANGAPLYRRGLGLANAELPVALSPNMRLRLGSATKQFCCFAIMLLAEAGKLSIDDSIRRHIPELHDWAEKITLHALMTHTSGVRCSLDVFALTCSIMSRPLAAQEQVRLLTRLQSVNFEPGETFLYSNGGYVLLTEVIRRASGASFEDFLKEEILTPIGLHDTMARPLDTDCVSNSASLHVTNKTGGLVRGVFGPAIGGEGSMVSTVDDMLLWLHHMSKPRLGSEATWSAMRTPSRLNTNASTGYGLGLICSNHRGLEIVFHTGHVMGGNCQILKAPALDLDLVIMTNVDTIDARSVAGQILDACVEGLDPVVVHTGAPVPLGKFFAAKSGRYLHLIEHEGGVALDFYGAKLPLKGLADGGWWLPANVSEGAIIKANGQALEWTEYGAVEIFRPLAPARDGETVEITGPYHCGEINAVAIVGAGGCEKLQIRTPYGRAEYRLENQGAGFWTLHSESAGWSGFIERCGEKLLLSSQQRTRRLIFERLQDWTDFEALS